MILQPPLHVDHFVALHRSALGPGPGVLHRSRSVEHPTVLRRWLLNAFHPQFILTMPFTWLSQHRLQQRVTSSSFSRESVESISEKRLEPGTCSKGSIASQQRVVVTWWTSQRSVNPTTASVVMSNRKELAESEVPKSSWGWLRSPAMKR